MSALEPLQPALERAWGFPGLDDATRRTLPAIVESRQLPAGTLVPHPDDDGHLCLLVCAGELEVRERRDSKATTHAGPGVLVGLESLLTDAAPALWARASVPSHVLVLTRAALLASPAGHQFGRQLVDELRLRVPLRPLPGCRVVRPLGVASPSAAGLLVHAQRGAYRLSAGSLVLWEHLDGHRTYQDLVLLYRENTGMLALQLVAQTLHGLDQAGFLAPLPLAPEVAAVLIPLGQHQHIRGQASRALTWSYTSTVLVAPLERLYGRAGRLLCTRTALALQTAIVAAGPLIVAHRGATFPQVVPRHPTHLLICAGALAGHELGHAVATLHSGYPVLGMGLGLRRLIPVAFVDTTALWLGSPRERLVVSVAGLWANLVLGGTLLIVARLSPRHAAPLVAGARISYGCALTSLLPLSSLDGPQALAALGECFGLPSTRRKASTRRRTALRLGMTALAYAGTVALMARSWKGRRHTYD